MRSRGEERQRSAAHALRGWQRRLKSLPQVSIPLKKLKRQRHISHLFFTSPVGDVIVRSSFLFLSKSHPLLNGPWGCKKGCAKVPAKRGFQSRTPCTRANVASEPTTSKHRVAEFSLFPLQYVCASAMARYGIGGHTANGIPLLAKQMPR